MAIKYFNFDLAIDELKAPVGRYRALVLASPADQASVLASPAGDATNDFELPFSLLEIENYILRIGHVRQGIRRLNSTEGQTAKEFGSKLYNAVFAGLVRERLYRSLGIVEKLPESGLRLRLHLSKSPSLLDIPWEYLYDTESQRFFAHSVTTPIVRYLALQSIRPLLVKPPLNILVMVANPRDVRRLDVETEWRNVKNALADLEQRGLVSLTRLEQATMTALQRQLRRGEYHIFHFVGHGDFDKETQKGVLLLEGENGQAHSIAGEDLGVLLYDHRSLRLAVLNACEGGRSTSRDLFAGVAQTLLRQNIPAVIAMQFAITDGAAIIFAREFYAALADNLPVDAALGEARKAIFTAPNDVEWGTPVLYLRSPDGIIFDTTIPPEIGQKTHNVPRRIDAAAPSHAEIEQNIDLLVQVRLPASPYLGIQDWPNKKQKPLSIEQATKATELKFPVDQRTGEPKPLPLRVRVIAPNFTFNGPAEERIEVSPHEESELLIFSLKAKHVGVCTIQVRVYDSKDMYLGSIPLETSVGKPAMPRTLNGASLVINITVHQIPTQGGSPVVASIDQAKINFSDRNKTLPERARLPNLQSKENDNQTSHPTKAQPQNSRQSISVPSLKPRPRLAEASEPSSPWLLVGAIIITLLLIILSITIFVNPWLLDINRTPISTVTLAATKASTPLSTTPQVVTTTETPGIAVITALTPTATIAYTPVPSTETFTPTAAPPTDTPTPIPPPATFTPPSELPTDEPAPPVIPLPISTPRVTGPDNSKVYDTGGSPGSLKWERVKAPTGVKVSYEVYIENINDNPDRPTSGRTILVDDSIAKIKMSDFKNADSLGLHQWKVRVIFIIGNEGQSDYQKYEGEWSEWHRFRIDP